MMMMMMMIMIIITILSSLVLTALYELMAGEEIFAALDNSDTHTHTPPHTPTHTHIHTHTTHTHSVGRLLTRDRFVAEIST
jgi:uncharacterized membrane protein